jgi:hypothetical protein
MFKFINFPTLVLSFLIGIVFNYVTEPEKTLVNVYPTPDNVERIEYTDKAGHCFRFGHKKVRCPGDKKRIKVIPIQ